MLTVGRASRTRRGIVLLACAGASVGVAACGSSGSSGSGASGNPQTLLRQTFSRQHTVRSGVLGFSLVITPKGSSLIQTPVSLSLGGPFQSRGAGKPPESALTIAFSGLGKKGSFGVRTTGSSAYVTLGGSSYQLPASDFAKLRSSLSATGSQSSAPGLSTFGIDPQDWLTSPKVVGTQTVDGVTTEHVHAGVNMNAFLQSLNKLLARESTVTKSTGASKLITPKITPALQRKIAAAVKDPTVDIYTGKSDSTLRKLVIGANVPVSGELSTRLGGMTSATFALTFDYTQLNQPQTIAAPSDVHSYAQLQTKLHSIGTQLQAELTGGLTSGATGSSGSSGSTGSTGSGSSSGKVSRYSSCISKAAGDVRKMRHCATLLQSGG